MPPTPNEDLNGRRDMRVVVDTNALDWTPSPAAGVVRKRLHRVGPPESGQVTSLVVYAPGSAFDRHPHPEGEEILVLDGVFSDETGDAPAGTHLLNPEGFDHAPFSREGCTLFVKLRQYAGAGRETRRTRLDDLPFAPTGTPGVAAQTLYADARFPETTRIERWSEGARVGRPLPGGAELFVLEGRFEEGGETHDAGTWLRLPPGAVLDATATAETRLYVKEGGVADLRASDD